MRLDRENGRCLGVCAGIANWLDVPATLVRIVFLICVISWPPLLLGYFILYFCLDKDLTPEKMQDYFSNAKTAEHFRQLNYRKPIYKNARNKRIAGVCSGIADYLEVSAFSVRVVTLCSLFIFGPFTFWAYIICMFVFDPDPHTSGSDRYERKMRRRERHAQRREARQARKTRKSYKNEEFQADVSEFEADIQDAVDQVQDDLKAEIDSAVSGLKKASKQRKTAESSAYSREECSALYSSLEYRLREIEAFMTSKKFRLHCQINRI